MFVSPHASAAAVVPQWWRRGGQVLIATQVTISCIACAMRSGALQTGGRDSELMPGGHILPALSTYPVGSLENQLQSAQAGPAWPGYVTSHVLL
jgi:hypothetical protein